MDYSQAALPGMAVSLEQRASPSVTGVPAFVAHLSDGPRLVQNPRDQWECQHFCSNRFQLFLLLSQLVCQTNSSRWDRSCPSAACKGWDGAVI